VKRVKSFCHSPAKFLLSKTTIAAYLFFNFFTPFLIVTSNFNLTEDLDVQGYAVLGRVKVTGESNLE